MSNSIRIGVAAGLLLASASAFAGDTLFWAEQGFSTRPFQAPPGFIKSGTDLPGGAVSTIVSGSSDVKGPNGVEFLGGRVWWPDQGTGDIRSVKPDGSDLRIYGAGINPYDVDLVGNTIYWSDQNGNSIFTLDSTDPSAASIQLLDNLSHPVAIDVVGNVIYWSEVAGTDRIRRSNLDGTNQVTLLSNEQSYDLEVTADYIYFTTTFGDVKRSALDGTGLTTLATGLGFLNGIDVTDSAIYVASYQFPGQIHRMGLDGSGQTSMYSTNDGFVRGVAVLQESSPVPEPSTLLLSALGIAGIALAARRR